MEFKAKITSGLAMISVLNPTAGGAAMIRRTPSSIMKILWKILKEPGIFFDTRATLQASPLPPAPLSAECLLACCLQLTQL